MPLVSSGVDHGNLRELAMKRMEELNLDLETYIPVVEKVLSTELAPRDSSVEVKDRCAKSKIDFIMCMFEASCEVLNLDDLSRKKQLNQLETTLQNPAVDLEKIARELLDKVNKQIEAGIKTAKDCDKLKIKQKKQLSQNIHYGQILLNITIIVFQKFLG